MSSIFSIPGKTFLAGEYLALDGGMALLAMTGPRFELIVKKGSGLVSKIPKGSPADLYIQRESQSFAGLDLEFRDPYLGAGGWGASTAQYLSVFAAKQTGGGSNEENLDEFETQCLIQDYHKDAWNGEGIAPSGADLIGQYKGGFTFFERKSGAISRHLWPFSELEGFLLRTGVKVTTHEHLRKLTTLNTTVFAAVMTKIREAWQNADSEAFCEGIADYGRELQAQKLVTEKTLSMLHDLLWQDGVKAAKGCGALGADVIFVVVEKDMRRRFEVWCEDQGHTAISLNDSVSTGLKLRHEVATTELSHV